MTKISILMPAYQERKFLARCLDSVLANDFDFAGSGSEILIIDGMSTDGSREIAGDYARRFPFIKLVDNPHTLTVKGLNIGIRQAEGEVLLWLGVHCEYPPDFVSECVKYLLETDAKSVGAAYRTVPSSDLATARAICRVLNSRLGVGLTYRTLDSREPIEVDTVPGGTWRRELFDEVGVFDEDFVRAQDFEFNTRLRRGGGRLLLLPWVKVRYFARESLGKFWRMAYQYGYWKVRVNKKYRALTTWRQVVPPLVTALDLLAGAGAPFWTPALVAFVAGNGLYLAATGLTACRGAAAERDARIVPAMMAAFACAHFGYGLGYLRGFVDFFVRRAARPPAHLTSGTR